ncbi:MAG: aminoacyl-tRNA hydrolase, partial [Anaerolineae bacterium]|nr:aminoacyl-tRNA hydrolase [Anaerolineae bacterium]
IIAALGTNEFARLRVGVGRPPEGWNPADFVLAPWHKSEEGFVQGLVDSAAQAIDTWLVDGLLTAMNRFNAGKG